jgi:hypothetical protein
MSEIPNPSYAVDYFKNQKNTGNKNKDHPDDKDPAQLLWPILRVIVIDECRLRLPVIHVAEPRLGIVAW